MSWIIVTIARDLIPILIEADYTRAGFRKVRCEASLRQHDRTTGVSQHEGQTYGRIRGIERQARRAGLELPMIPTIISKERSMKMPTTSPVTTPRPRR